MGLLLCKSFLPLQHNLACFLTYFDSALHFLSAADLGQPSRLTISGKVTFDKEDDDHDDGNPPQLPIFRDVEATGAGQVGFVSRKTGADSPSII